MKNALVVITAQVAVMVATIFGYIFMPTSPVVSTLLFMCAGILFGALVGYVFNHGKIVQMAQERQAMEIVGLGEEYADLIEKFRIRAEERAA
jgi:hypothetical protein